MALTHHPYLAFENLLYLEGATLTSGDVAADSDLNNLRIANLGIVTAFEGTSIEFILDCGAAASAASLYLRFRGGWQTIQSVSLIGSANPDLSAPDFDEEITGLWPAAWDIRIPKRPIARIVDEVGASDQYWGVQIERDSDAEDLTVAACQISVGVQLNSLVDGIAAYGHSVDVESATEEIPSDLDNDFRFARSPRRLSSVKLECSSQDRARSSWAKKLQFACHNHDILYCYNPIETDPALIQFETLWGLGRLSGFSFAGFDDWEGSLTVRERT